MSFAPRTFTTGMLRVLQDETGKSERLQCDETER